MQAAIRFTGCELIAAARAAERAAARALARVTARGRAGSKPVVRGSKLAVVGRRRQVLVDGVKKLGLRGAAVGASVAGHEFSDPMFHPFWAKAEELGVLIFIHPQSTPDLARRFKGNGWLANTIGNPLDTTIALSHLIFEGTLDRFPRLKICSAHGGGFLPSYAPRSDNSLRVAPDMDTGVKLKKKPTEYLRQMYYDTLVFTGEALRHLAAEGGAHRPGV